MRLVARGGWKLAQDVLIMIEVNPLKPEDGKTLKRSHQNESSQDFSSTYFQSKKKKQESPLEIWEKIGVVEHYVILFLPVSSITPQRMNECHLERDHLKRKCCLPTTNFQGICEFSSGFFLGAKPSVVDIDMLKFPHPQSQ